MIEKSLFVILILNATGLFRVFGLKLGVEIGLVSFALLALHVAYLLLRRRHLWPVLRVRDTQHWLGLLLVWPLVTMVYAPALELRQLGLQVYHISLFLAAIVYGRIHGLVALHRVFVISLAVSVVGVVLSFLAPSYFDALARSAGAGTEYQGRAFGFFLQPNAAAKAITYLFLGWYSLWRHKTRLWDYAAILGLLAVVLLTGSRTGALTATLICVLTVFQGTIAKLKRNNEHFGFAFVKPVLLVSLVGIGLVLANGYASSRLDEGGVFSRMSMLTSLRLSENGISSDGSTQARREAQQVYWTLIRERPLLGHGFGAEVHYQEVKGIIQLNSHSTALSVWMEYGAGYSVAFALVLARMLARRQRKPAEALFGTSSILQLVAISAVWFTVSGGLFGGREFYVTLAYFFLAEHPELQRHRARPELVDQAR